MIRNFLNNLFKIGLVSSIFGGLLLVTSTALYFMFDQQWILYNIGKIGLSFVLFGFWMIVIDYLLDVIF